MGKLNDFVGQIEKASEFNRKAFMLNDMDASAAEGSDEFVELHAEAIDLLYDDFNGQSAHGLKLFGEFQLLSLKKAKKFWGEQCDINGEFECECSDQRLKDGFGWRRKWFPFCWDQNRNGLLMLDFDPSQHGNTGQVFGVAAGNDPGRFVASSLDEFLDKRLTQMAAADYQLDHGELPMVFPV